MTNQPDNSGARTGSQADRQLGTPDGNEPDRTDPNGAGVGSSSSNADDHANMASRDESLRDSAPDSAPSEEPQLDPQTRKQASRAMLKYGGARLGLFLGLTIVIQALAVLIGAQVPLVVSALLALLVALPLSMLIFKKLRIETTQAVAKLAQQRKARKEWVNRELAGR